MPEFKNIIGDFLINSRYIGCVVVDKSGEILFSNNTFDSFIKAIDGSVIGYNFIDIFREEEQSKIQGAFDHLFKAGELPQREWEIENKFDEYIFLDVEGEIIESNGEKYALACFIDRTNERTLKSEIEQKSIDLTTLNLQQDLAIKTAKLGTWKVNLNTGDNIWNDELLNIYDLTEDEFEGSIAAWEKHVHPDDFEDTDAKFKTTLNGDAVNDVRFRIISAKGKVKHILASAVPIKNPKGETTEIHGINVDITQFVESTESALFRENQVKNITNNIRGVVLQYIFHADGTESIDFVNQGIKEILELEPEEVLTDSELIFKIIDDKDALELRADLFKCNETMEPLESYFNITTKSGKRKRLHAKGTPSKGDNGDINWDTIIFDITKQTKLDEAIQEQERYIKNITNQVPGLVFIYQLHPDGSDQFQYLSKGVEDTFEIAQDVAMKDTSVIWACIHPEDVAELSQSIQQSAETLSQWEAVYRIVTPSGKLKYIQGSGIPEKLENGTYQWYSMGLDITQQKIQELKIHEKQKHLNVIADQFPGVIYTYVRRPDGKEKITYLSNGAESIHGIDIESAYKDSSVLWSLVHPDDIPKFLETIEKSSRLMGTWENLFRVKVIDESYHWFRGYGKPTLLDDGSIMWSSITFDVHDQITAQAEILAQKERLESITNQINGVVLKYRVHPDGTDSIPFISRRVNEFWGVDAETVVEDINKAWARVVPEDLEPTQQAVQDSMKDMSEWIQIMRFVSHTGEIKHLQGYGLPKLLEDGTVEYDTVMIDVTDQELAKLEAKEKQRELDLIGDQIPGVVFSYFRRPDGSDGFINFSDGFEELHGFDREVALENPRVLWEQTHPEDLPGFITALMESAANMSKLDFQYRIIRPDGEIRYLQGFGSPSIQDDGTIVWNAINLDITDRKLAELEIAEKSQQLRNITDQFPGVILQYALLPDGSDKLLYISDGVEELYGVSKEEILADPTKFWDQMLEDDLEELKASIAKSAETMTPWDQVYRYYNKDDEIGYLQGYGTPHKTEDGTVIWDAITMDITKRMNAELEAQQSSSKLRAFIKSSPIAIYQINPEGVVTDFWNAAAENVYGWTRNEVIDSRMPQLWDDDLEEFQGIIEDIRASKKPKQFQVTRHNRYNEEIILEITAGPLFDEYGKLTDLLIIANDISELEEYRKTLESALREKEILLQEIHHRVKNNLAIVSGLLELQALKDDSDRDMSLIIEARNRIHSIAMVHEQLYQDMDFSHINPKEYYKKLLSKLQANTISKETDIEYDLKFDIAKININRAVPLGLLINELFTNSIKHAFPDGKGKVKLHFEQAGDQIKVEYADNGPGFVIDDIKHKNTIGWQLIETLLMQLDSTFTMDTKNKFHLKFEFTEAVQGSQSHFT